MKTETPKQRLAIYKKLRQELEEQIDQFEPEEFYLCLWFKDNVQELGNEMRKYISLSPMRRRLLFRWFPELKPYRKEICNVINSNNRRLEIVEEIIKNLS